jgi:nucleotide-binding universal stress UspA family protein
VSGVHRVIVGTSGSPGNLCAIRYAEDLARACDATLIPIHVWTPPGGDLAERHSPCLDLRRIWSEDAWRVLWNALNAAWGEIPDDPPVEPVVQRGAAGPALADFASRAGDLLVLGAGRRGGLSWIGSGRVSRYCLAHARCPVLAVPPPTLPHHAGHGPFRWAFWHRTLTPEQFLRDQGKTAA